MATRRPSSDKIQDTSTQATLILRNTELSSLMITNPLPEGRPIADNHPNEDIDEMLGYLD
jgi:hypothetical protein